MQVPARQVQSVATVPPAGYTDRAPGGRETILLVAATLFSTKGYAESGLREIADGARMRSSSVYHHFDSKEGIYIEIIRIAVERISHVVDAALAALPARATPRMRVEAAIGGHLRALHGNKPYTSTNAHARVKLPDQVNGMVAPIRDRYSDFWRALLEDAGSAGYLRPELEPRMLRPLILGTINRTVGWFDPAKGSVESLVATMITMFSGIWADQARGRRRKDPILRNPR